MYKIPGLCCLLFALSIQLNAAESTAAEPHSSAPLGRDPTRPLNFHSSANALAVKLKLNSIFISGTRKLAVINGQTLRVGEQLASSSFRLTNIAENKVVLSNGKDSRVLYLAPLVVKPAVKSVDKTKNLGRQ